MPSKKLLGGEKEITTQEIVELIDRRMSEPGLAAAQLKRWQSLRAKFQPDALAKGQGK